jgi:hypothetical protein
MRKAAIISLTLALVVMAGCATKAVIVVTVKPAGDFQPKDSAEMLKALAETMPKGVRTIDMAGRKSARAAWIACGSTAEADAVKQAITASAGWELVASEKIRLDELKAYMKARAKK